MHLRILHCMSSRELVGEAARALDLAETETGLGHRSLLLLRHGSAAAAEAERRGLPFREAAFAGGLRLLGAWKDICLLRRIVAEENIDIVHVHRSKEHWLAALSGVRVPIVRTRHVMMPLRHHFANRWLYGRATAGVICVSSAVAEIFRRSLPFYRGLLAIIPGGAAVERLHAQTAAAGQALRHRLGIAEDAQVITLLARLDRVKGHLTLVAAMPEILRHCPEAVFLFAYPRQSIYRQEVEEAIAKQGLANKVFWLGPQVNIAAILAITAVGVIASIGSEGWSRAAVEFIAAGVPVVGTAVGSVPEIIRHGETGLIVQPADASSLANAVCRLLTDQALYGQMHSACSAAAAYTLRRMTEDSIAFYRQAAADQEMR